MSIDDDVMSIDDVMNINEDLMGFDDDGMHGCDIDDNYYQGINFSDMSNNSFANSDQSFNKQFTNMILRLIADHNLTNKCTQDVLNILKFYDKNRDKLKIPNSVYLLKKNLDIDLDTKYGFRTECCGTEMFLNKKEFKNKKCSNCNLFIDSKEILLSNNYFFQYSLVKQVVFLVNHYGLKKEQTSKNSICSFYDSKKFKNFKDLNPGKIIAVLSADSDGVPVSKKVQVWPNFLEIKNLDTSIDKRIFLNSCFKVNGKPKLDFFLRNFIRELNILSKGVYIDRYKTEVFFSLHNYLFDSVARAYFLCHISHSGYFSCTQCLIQGVSIRVGKGFSVVFPFESESKLRSLDLLKFILERYECSNTKAPFGVKGETELLKIEGFDSVLDVTLEPMHCFFLGIVKYNLSTSLDANLSKVKSFIGTEMYNIINGRIKNFIFNSEFKRSPDTLEQLQHLKANQFFDSFFYIFPVVFESILDKDVYNHFLMLVYILALTWNGGFNSDYLVFLKKLSKTYLSQVSLFYDKRNETNNNHHLNHLIDTFERHGPLKDMNAFIFESKNNELINSINSSYGILEQIENKFLMNFKINLDSENKPKDLSIKPLGKPIYLEGKESYKKIQIGKKFYSSFDENHKSRKYDCFFETNDNKFICVLYFFVENNQTLFKGTEFEKISNYSFNATIEDKNYVCELDHLIHVRKTDHVVIKNALEIKQKVNFNFKFVDNNSDRDCSLGTIARMCFSVHN